MNLRYYSILILLFIVIPIWSEERPDSEICMVQMRDGLKLATKIYFPEEGDGPWPILLSRTPYGKGTREEHEKFLSKGIIVIIQEVRGTGDSEGTFDLLASSGWGEKQDGFDTVEWIMAQPWCNGKIATFGGSAVGHTQILLAGTGPGGLVGQHIIVASIGSYRTYYKGGVFRKLFVETITGWYRGQDQVLNTVRSHYTYDDYWKTQNLAERADRVNWPVLLKTGWFDLGLQGAIDTYNTIRSRGGSKARNQVCLTICPCGHGIEAGQFKFPEEIISLLDEVPYEDYFHWLLDSPAPDKIPAIKYFTMGENPIGNSPGNEWKTSQTWPPENSRLIPFYLAANDNLKQKKSEPSKVNFVYDPKNPVPTNGGQVAFNLLGAFDQSESEKREDVIVFSTPILKEPVEVTGRMTAVLYVSTSAVDTDFTTKICDVYPDGRSMMLTRSIRRLSFRNSYEKHELATPGKIYKLEIDLLSTSMVFNTGHRIRVDISSSNSPWLEPNPNTGVPNDSIEHSIKANQTIYLGGDHASYINLPIVGSLDGLN